VQLLDYRAILTLMRSMRVVGDSPLTGVGAAAVTRKNEVVP